MKLCAICGNTSPDSVNCCCPTCGEASWYTLPYVEPELVPVPESDKKPKKPKK